MVREQTFHGRDELVFIPLVKRSAARAREAGVDQLHESIAPHEERGGPCVPVQRLRQLFFRCAGSPPSSTVYLMPYSLMNARRRTGFCNCSASSNDSATISSPWLWYLL